MCLFVCLWLVPVAVARVLDPHWYYSKRTGTSCDSCCPMGRVPVSALYWTTDILVTYIQGPLTNASHALPVFFMLRTLVSIHCKAHIRSSDAIMRNNILLCIHRLHEWPYHSQYRTCWFSGVPTGAQKTAH